MEVMEARLIRAAEINGEVDDDDTGGSEARGAQGGLNGKLGYHLRPPDSPGPGLSPSWSWAKATEIDKRVEVPANARDYHGGLREP